MPVYKENEFRIPLNHLTRTSNAGSQFQIRLTLFTVFRKSVKDFTGFQNMKEPMIS